jgi:hypothetical protein
VSKPNKAEYAGFQSSLCRRQGRILKTEEKKMEKEQQGFNIEALVEELDNEFDAEAEDQLEESDEDLEELEEEVLDDEEEVLEEEQAEEEPEPEVDEDIHKRNEAFRRLREERDALAQSDKFLTDMAKQYGLTKGQLMERFQEDQLKKQAKEQGIPEDQLRKMQEMERRLAEVEESKNREVFNIKAGSLATRYGLNDNQMTLLFKEAARMGLDIIHNPDLLEFAYKAVNYENAVDQGRQKQLETTKKRRATSTGSTGTKGREPVSTEDDNWEKEIDSLLKDLQL